MCGCPDLSLGYNPNTEAGGLTQFHCTTQLAWDQLPVRLGAGARCYLRCGYILVAAIHCRWLDIMQRGDLGVVTRSYHVSSSWQIQNTKSRIF